ncbi:hypothetical protein BX666DRAFT_1942306 [Dichotomocladium elegans]|nr:hypothetical protein BX666DRAFT_1942306 [Dichotomocladium elegans]
MADWLFVLMRNRAAAAADSGGGSSGSRPCRGGALAVSLVISIADGGRGCQCHGWELGCIVGGRLGGLIDGNGD